MAARKSMVYLNSMLPVTITEEDLIKQKLKPGKFVLTLTANIKIAGILCLLGSVAIMLAGDSYCNDEKNYWLLTLIADWMSIIATLLLYFIFSFGMTVKKPLMWVRIDIFVNLILSLLTLISSVLATNMCTASGSTGKVPGPLGITGGSILLIGCASMFLMYRFQEDEEVVQQAPAPKAKPELSRKSIFA